MRCAPSLVSTPTVLALTLAACGPDRSLSPALSAGPASASVTDSAQIEALGAGSEKRGTITIVLDVLPDGPVDVPFASIGQKLEDFTLDDDADPALPRSITFDKVKPGTYSVQQQTVAGFTLAALICTSSPNGGSGTDNNAVFLRTRLVVIELEPAESVTCTFPVKRDWQNGDLITYSQASWSDDATASGLLLANFATVYASPGWLEVGISGPTGFSMFFTSPSAVRDYLPAGGTAGPLDANLVNPLTTASGTFGGEVTALALNVDFSDAGHTVGPTGIRFGDLTVCDFIFLQQLNGLTVRDFLGVVSTALGGGSAVYSIAQLSPVVVDLNAAFGGGVATSFAQSQLVAGACPGA